MSTGTNRWKLGLFVTLGVVTSVGAVLSLGARRFQRETQQVVTYFDESVQGLEVGSQVKFRGVTIGNVSAIRVARDRRHVVVEAEVHTDSLLRLGLTAPGEDPDAALAKAAGAPGARPPAAASTHGTDEDDLVARVQLASAGITGQRFLLVDLFDVHQHPYPSEVILESSRNFLPSAPSTMRGVEDAIVQAVEAFPEMLARVKEILARIDGALKEADVSGVSARATKLLDTAERRLSELDVPRLAAELERLIADVRAVTATLDGLAKDVGSETGAVKGALADVRRLAREAEKAIAAADVGGTAASIRAAGTSVGAATRGAAETLEEAQKTMAALREALDAVRRLADGLERDPGALLRGKSPEAPPGAGGRP